MATLGRSLRRLRDHAEHPEHPEHPRHAALAAVGAAAVVYLGLHQEVLAHLNLLIGP